MRTRIQLTACAAPAPIRANFTGRARDLVASRAASRLVRPGPGSSDAVGVDHHGQGDGLARRARWTWSGRLLSRCEGHGMGRIAQQRARPNRAAGRPAGAGPGVSTRWPTPGPASPHRGQCRRTPGGLAPRSPANRRSRRDLSAWKGDEVHRHVEGQAMEGAAVADAQAEGARSFRAGDIDARGAVAGVRRGCPRSPRVSIRACSIRQT